MKVKSQKLYTQVLNCKSDALTITSLSNTEGEKCK